MLRSEEGSDDGEQDRNVDPDRPEKVPGEFLVEGTNACGESLRKGVNPMAQLLAESINFLVDVQH